MTREELDEQLSSIAHRVAIHGVRAEATAGLPPKEAIGELKQLIRDCIEAVKNEATQQNRHHTDDRADWCGTVANVCVCDEIIRHIEANTKELLG